MAFDDLGRKPRVRDCLTGGLQFLFCDLIHVLLDLMAINSLCNRGDQGRQMDIHQTQRGGLFELLGKTNRMFYSPQGIF